MFTVSIQVDDKKIKFNNLSLEAYQGVNVKFNTPITYSITENLEKNLKNNIFLMDTHIDISYLLKYNYTDGYYIWINSYGTLFDLYKFDKSEQLNTFIDGFILLCNTLNIDFRDYIAGLPIHYMSLTNNIIFLQIKGYDVRNNYFFNDAVIQLDNNPFMSVGPAGYASNNPDYE